MTTDGRATTYAPRWIACSRHTAAFGRGTKDAT